ncbi:hypothetical protein ACP2W0_17955 [Pseudobacillus badius]|uniref:hypothetical protein n=1 Tax=Bacillus badius TaxID=1455 RepID=UPI003CF802A5
MIKYVSNQFLKEGILMWLEENTRNFILISCYCTLGIAIVFTLYVWYKQKFSRTYLWFLGSFIVATIGLFIWTQLLIGPIYLEPELASPEEDFPKMITAALLGVFSIGLLLAGISKKK